MVTYHTWDQFFQSVLIGLAPFVAAGIGVLIQQGFSLIRRKSVAVKNDDIRNGLMAAESEAERLSHMIVTSLNQTVVEGLKAQNGNKLSPEDARKIRNDALNNVLNLMSSESVKILTEHKGDIVDFIGHLIEQAVSDKKAFPLYSDQGSNA